MPVDKPGETESAVPIDEIVTTVAESVAPQVDDSTGNLPVAVDQSGWMAHRDNQDDFDKTFADEFGDAVVADPAMDAGDVMLAILDHGKLYRDRMLVFDEQNIREYVPYRNWFEGTSNYRRIV